MNDKFNFNLKLLIYTRPNLRDSNLQFEMFMDQDVLVSMFDKFELRSDIIKLFLSFPERWLNILEQRILFQKLLRYCPNLKEVTIKTHSVYLVQCAHKEECYIMDDASLILEDADLEKELCVSTKNSDLFDLDKLNICYGR